MREIKRFFYDYTGIIILVLAILLCVAAYPMGHMNTKYVSGKQIDTESLSLIFGEDDEHKDDKAIKDSLKIEGSFITTRSGLNELAFRFTTKGTANEGKLTLSVYDSYGEKIDEVEIASYDAMNYHWAKFPLTGKYESDTTYMYELEVSDYDDTSLFLSTADVYYCPEETQNASLGDEKMEGRVPLIRYTYKAPVDETTKKPFYIFISITALFAYGAWSVIRSKKSGREKLVVQLQRLIPWALVLFAGINLIAVRDMSHEPVRIVATDHETNDAWTSNTSIGVNADSGFRGVFLNSERYVLKAGKYEFDAIYHVTLPTEDELKVMALTPKPEGYEEPEPNYFTIYNGEEELLQVELDDEASVASAEVELEKDCDDIHYTISFGGGYELLVDSVIISCEDGFYNDATFVTVIFVILMLLLLAVALLIRGGYMSIKTVVIGCAITLIGVAGSIPLMSEGLNWAVDLGYHLGRIEGIKDGLVSGQFPVVIFPEALNGNGYLNVMYPAGLIYPAAWIRSMGVSLADSYKFIMIMAGILCALFTYMAVKTMSGSTQAGLLAALLYTLAPYRFTNVYARGAVGEALAMTFFPLLLAGLYHVLVGNKNKWVYLAAGMTGLLYCHVLSFVMGLSLCIVFSLFFIRKLFKLDRLLACVKAGVVTLILGAGFYVPFLDFYQHENLWKDILVDNADYRASVIRLPSLLGGLPTSDYHQLSMGLTITMAGVLAVAGMATLKTLSQGRLKKESLYGFTSLMTVLGIVLIFMTSEFFPNTSMEQVGALNWLFENFQFSWRLIAPASLMFAVAGSVFVYKNPILKNYSNAAFVVLAALTLISAGRYSDMDYIFGDGDYTKGHLEKLEGYTSRDALYPYEWRLRGTTPASIVAEPVVSDEEGVEVVSYERKGVTSTLVYIATMPEGYVEVPVQAYMGYEVSDEVLGAVEYETGNGNRIRIPAVSDSLEHTVTITYHVPVIYKIACWISFIAFIVFFIFLVAGDFIMTTIEGRRARKYAEYEDEYGNEYDEDPNAEEEDEYDEDSDEYDDEYDDAYDEEPDAEDDEYDEESDAEDGEYDDEYDEESDARDGENDDESDDKDDALDDESQDEADEDLEVVDVDDLEEDLEGDFDEITDDELDDESEEEIDDTDSILLERREDSMEDDDSELEGMDIVEDTTVSIPVDAIEKAIRENDGSETDDSKTKAVEADDMEDDDFETEELEEIEE